MAFLTVLPILEYHSYHPNKEESWSVPTALDLQSVHNDKGPVTKAVTLYYLYSVVHKMLQKVGLWPQMR